MKTLLFIILLPSIVVLGLISLTVGAYFYRHVLAIFLWITSVITFYLPNGDYFWWAFAIFMLGCASWAWGQQKLENKS